MPATKPPAKPKKQNESNYEIKRANHVEANPLRPGVRLNGVSCVSSGQNFDESKVSQIKKGEATEADMIQMFGQPQMRGVNSDGMTTLTWEYMGSRVKGESFIPYAGPFIGGSKSQQKMLTATIGPDGKVTSFNSSAGGMESRSNQVQDVPKK